MGEPDHRCAFRPLVTHQQTRVDQCVDQGGLGRRRRNLSAQSRTPGGRLVLYVPQGAKRFSSLDRALDHRCRYERAALVRELESAGFTVESCRDFNRAGVPGWWLNGRVLRRTRFSRVQLKIFNALVPLLRVIDRFLPWKGLGLLVVARRAG